MIHPCVWVHMNDDWRIGEAIRHDRVELLERLLESRTSKTDDLSEYLMDAAMWGAIRTARYLISCGADINSREGEGQFTPLHAAALGFGTASAGMVRLLIRAGADVDAPAGNGLTPLDCAELRGRAETVALLVQAGGHRSGAQRRGGGGRRFDDSKGR